MLQSSMVPGRCARPRLCPSIHAIDTITDTLTTFVERWPGDRAAVVVTGPSGVVAAAGALDHPFRLASVTKLFTATAVLVAVEEGTVDLDTPAGPAGSTVAHLLAHASGLGPDGEVLAAPGRRRIYSNAGYEVLADTVAAAAGMDFVTYATEAVVGPLGLGTTDLGGPAAHGATATAHDVGLLASAWMTPGTLLASSTVAEATDPFLGDLDGVLPGFGSQHPNPWGLGPEIRGHKSPHWTGSGNSPTTFGHFGRSGTFCWVDPVAGHALVGLGEEPFGAWSGRLWPALSDVVLEAVASRR